MEAVAALLGLGALLLVLVLVTGLYVSRQRALTQRVGSFRCLVRHEPPPVAGWTPGIAQYATGRLVWWRTLSLSPRPARTWNRSDLTLVGRVALDEVDDDGQPLVLVHCRHGEQSFQLSMSVAACSGLVSWLEAGPRRAGRVL